MMPRMVRTKIDAKPRLFERAKIKTSSKGFTIVELLIVVVVIAILAAILLMSFNGIQRSAQNSETLANVRQALSAIQMYVQEKGEPPLLGQVVNMPAEVVDGFVYYAGASVCLGEGYPGGVCGYMADSFDPYELDNIPEEPLLCQQLSEYVRCPFMAMAGGNRTVSVVFDGDEWQYKNAVYTYHYDEDNPKDWYYTVSYALAGNVSCGLSGAVEYENTSFGDGMTYCYYEEFGGNAKDEWIFE